jgi:chemotaxis response regulator CheB
MTSDDLFIPSVDRMFTTAANAVVFGMPQEVIAAGVVDDILALPQMPALLTRVLK